MNTNTAEVNDASDDRRQEVQNALIWSYLKQRRVIGYLGMSLPFTVFLGALIFFQTGLQGSISSYYYTGMRDVFVGTLWAIGFFLYAYRGYDKFENRLGNLACLFAVGVSLFPTAPLVSPSTLQTRIGYLHLFSAAGFFFTLMWFSLFLFTKSDQPEEAWPPQKRLRNRVYKTCGAILAVCIVLMGLTGLLPARVLSVVSSYNPIFWLETIAVIAFGFSWFTKGEGILKDDLSTVTNTSLSAGSA